MQPYLFPYIGYFQLVNAVDVFIYHDDVQYIKGGWINRNRLLLGQSAKYFSYSIIKDSYKKKINERCILNIEESNSKLLNILYNYYNKAPFYNKVINVIKDSLDCSSRIVSDFIIHSNQVLCNFLGIHSKIIKSSDLKKNDNLKAHERVIDICKTINGSHYINPQGGTELYNRNNFEAEGIKLSFLVPKQIIYPQYENEFVPNLSIIDLMMFNSQEKIKEMLNDYELI